jgi:hypothetical protein
MEFTDAFKTLFIETAHVLKGSARRLFMARTVKAIGPGGQRYAEREFGWNRGLIRTGTHALASGFRCLDAYAARGRKRAEAPLPNLLDDIRAMVESQSQAAPQLRPTRLSTRLSATAVRRHRLVQKGSLDDGIRMKLSADSLHEDDGFALVLQTVT